ncbi:hypothetical protein MRB53_025400 [Persea americana]|uniref:Uncharacterized protein n=1 Tax=Persea americana TaxID=3435 RepID=A0ACC2LF56_PERAE|nr:hypothetical protein MRB53_025400 [Persea americana]
MCVKLFRAGERRKKSRRAATKYQYHTTIFKFSGQRNCHFMDTIPQTTDVSQDVARDSLIAISELSPDSSLSASKLLPDNPNNVNEVGSKESDNAEDYRTELISISYTQSPDGEKNSPSVPRKSQ